MIENILRLVNEIHLDKLLRVIFFFSLIKFEREKDKNLSYRKGSMFRITFKQFRNHGGSSTTIFLPPASIFNLNFHIG